MEGSGEAAVARARAGDREAFRILVETHSPAVFRLAYRMTGHEEDAEDVVQETFLKAYRSLPNFQGKAGFTTWLHRIAANCAVDLVRARAARPNRRGSSPSAEPVVRDLLPAYERESRGYSLR